VVSGWLSRCSLSRLVLASTASTVWNPAWRGDPEGAGERALHEGRVLAHKRLGHLAPLRAVARCAHCGKVRVNLVRATTCATHMSSGAHVAHKWKSCAPRQGRATAVLVRARTKSPAARSP
jgi:hypothetical protein